MYLFFDTETTGLPLNWKAPMHDLDNWPRVLQLAWGVVDDTDVGPILRDGLIHKSLIKPDGWTVPDGDFWVEHGYSTAGCEAEGRPIAEVLDEFLRDLNTCRYLISHNLSFDYNVLGAELLRAGKKADRRLRQICTKEASTDWCQIAFPGQRRYPGRGELRFKWPTLAELHHKLFGRGFEGAHDAGADVVALKDCFFGLVQAKVIVLDHDRFNIP